MPVLAGDPGLRFGRRRLETVLARLATLPTPALAAVAVGLAVMAVIGVLTGHRVPGSGPIGMTLTMAAAFGPLGVLVLRRVPGHPLGALMLACGTLAAGAAVAVCWSGLLVAAWASQWLWLPPLALVPLMLLLFPDGQLPSRRWWGVAVLVVGSTVVAVLSLAVAALDAPRTLLAPTAGPLAPGTQILVTVAFAALGLLVLCAAVVGLSLLLRWRAATGLSRRQLVCLLPSAVLLAVGISLDYLDVPGGWIPAAITLPLGLTIAIVQYQLFDLDLFIHRGLVWLTLTGLAVATYAAAVAVGGRLIGGQVIGDQGSYALPVVGALVAAGLLPAERLAQRAVRRLVYGRTDDPYAVLGRVGRHIEQVRDPLAVLPRFVATLVDELRVPYAAIVLPPTGDEPKLRVEHGRRFGDVQSFAMRAHGTEVGQLLVSARRPGERFSTIESSLLTGLAGQAAIAAEACRSTLEIQRSRERLVFAREEERRRLRRDLHDGLASTLIGARMLAVAARRDADEKSARWLDDLSADLDTCTHQVRELIDGLRPAALDHGLAEAVRHLLERTHADGLRITLDVAGDLADLPAAIETAGYRIVTEAVTNVTKHAQASACAVLLKREGSGLRIVVQDNGRGLPPGVGADKGRTEAGARQGVGLGSIRSRVEEVGGTVDFGSGPEGTRWAAFLPVAPDAAGSDPTMSRPPE